MIQLTRRRVSRSAAAFLSLALAAGRAAAAPPAEPVAVVYAANGEAFAAAPGRSAKPVRLFDWLVAGTTVSVVSGSVAIAFTDGNRFELPARARAVVEPSGLRTRRGEVRRLAPVSPFPRLSGVTSDVRGSRPGAIVVRANEMTGLRPEPGQVCRASGVEFSFDAVPGASLYRVEAADAAGSIVFRTDVAVTRAVVPRGVLDPGGEFTWCVRTLDLKGATATGEAWFSTLDALDESRLDALREGAERGGGAADWTLLAAIELRRGLLADARRSAARVRAIGGDPTAARVLDELLAPAEPGPKATPRASF